DKEPRPTERPQKEVKPLREKRLSSEEMAFLEFVSLNPELFVTQLYKKLELSGYKGDRLKGALMDKGLIVQEETRQGKGGRLTKFRRKDLEL
ncbi:MAG: hypothetical protein V3T30_06600, partial [Thermodesulfobacteriota bacterium]